MNTSQLQNTLSKSKIAELIKEFQIDKNRAAIVVDKDDIITVLKHLKNAKEFQFQMLLDICAVDYPDRTPRFEVVYQMLSLVKNTRLTIKVRLKEDEHIESATSLFPCAGWCEREVWDLFGIPFSNHLDLRRLLSDYGFVGYSGRKDFPLTGYVEVEYDSIEERVKYAPVYLPQEYRNFNDNSLSPWEGTEYILPGDEKATR